MLISSLLIAAATAGATPIPLPSPSDIPWEASRYSSKITECDRLIAHPDDPNKLTPGVEHEDADLPPAIEACKKAVAADPENPRLNYQLARALGYSGLGKQAYKYRKVAVDANYPQSLFVIGYITLFGMNEQPKDVCLGADLIRRSAEIGRIAGQVGYPYWLSEGKFDSCKNNVGKAKMLEWLKAARVTAKGDFYRETLVDMLTQRIQNRF